MGITECLNRTQYAVWHNWRICKVIRPNMIRYAKLGQVELNVTDLDRSRRFYDEVVGLQYVGTGATGEIQFRCDSEHHSISLHLAAQAGLKRVGFILEDHAQFKYLENRLKKENVPWQEVPRYECRIGHNLRAIRIFEPNTAAILEFYVRAEEKQLHFVPKDTKIQRIGHVVFNVLNTSATTKFWREVLNFRESDSIGEAVTFMRCFPNPYHHGVAFESSTRQSLHHLNFMVSEIDDIGKALSRFRLCGVPVVFGPGRHVASGSVFLYFLDPDGLTLEYSFGMEEFEEAFPREARALKSEPKTIDRWESAFDFRAFNLSGPNEMLIDFNKRRSIKPLRKRLEANSQKH